MWVTYTWKAPTSFNLFLFLDVQPSLSTKQKLFYACPNRRRKPRDGSINLNLSNVLQDLLITRGFLSTVILKETVLLRGFWTWQQYRISIPVLKPPQEWTFLCVAEWYLNRWHEGVKLPFLIVFLLLLTSLYEGISSRES